MNFTSYEPGVTKKVAVGAASVPSEAIGSGGKPQTVRLFASVGTCIAIGDIPSASADGFELAAGIPEYIDIRAGQKIAAIRAAGVTAAGVLKITLCEKRSF